MSFKYAKRGFFRVLTKKYFFMTSEKLTYSSRACLLNSKIVDIGENWIKLDNGWIIYLCEDEISFLNSSFEQPEKNN